MTIPIIESATGFCGCDICPSRKECADKLLACENFARWINKMPSLSFMPPLVPKPTRAMYRYVYENDSIL